MSTLPRQAASGAAFGAALSLSGVWVPSVIISQLKLEDFRMLRMFLTASGASLLIFGLFSGRGLPKSSPRSPSPIAGVLSSTGTYAGNIIGGTMQGVGMALAGACATTVFVQASLGTQSGLHTLAGAAVGGFLHVPVGRWIKERNAAAAAKDKLPERVDAAMPSASKEAGNRTARLTIYEQLGTSHWPCTLAAEVITIGMVAGLALQPKTAASAAMDKAYMNPVVGGLLVAAAQVAALVTKGSPLGVSNVFDEAGSIVWASVDSVMTLGRKGTGNPKKRLSVTGLAFAGGMMLAAAGTVRYVLPRLASPAAVNATVTGQKSHQSLSVVRAVVGGVLIGFGSRISGGCTSGHGISGLGLLSTSSLVTTTCMFGSGIIFGLIL